MYYLCECLSVCVCVCVCVCVQDVSCNELMELPEQMSALESLCYLNMRRNHLTTLSPSM